MASSESAGEGKKDSEKKKYWNRGSYKYYVRYPNSVSNPKPVTSLKNRQVKTFYVISTLFKVARVVAVVLIALILIGYF